MATESMHYVTAWRQYFDLTAAELARRSGLTDSFLNQIEKGRSLPSLPTLHQIAKGLDIPAGMLVSIDPETLDPADNATWSDILLSKALAKQREWLTNSMDIHRATLNMLVEKVERRQAAKRPAKHNGRAPPK